MSELDDLYSQLVNTGKQAHRPTRAEFKPLILDDEEQDIDTNVTDQKSVPQYVDTNKPKFVNPARRSYYVAGNFDNNEINTTAQKPNEIEYEADTVDDDKRKDNYFGLTKLATNKKDIVKNIVKNALTLSLPTTLQQNANKALEGFRGFAGSTVDFASSLTRFFGQNYMYYKGYVQQQLDRIANIGNVATGGNDLSNEIEQKYTDFYNRIDRQTKEFKDKTEHFLEYTGIAKTDKDGFIYDLVGGGASLAYAIGLAAITKSPAAAAEFFGMYQYQGLYEEGIQKGFSAIKARTLGVAGGIAEAGLEMVGLHVLIETLAARKSFAKLLKAAATEFVQEASQQGTEETLAKVFNLRQESISQILYNVGYAGVIGAVLGGGSAAVSNGLHKAISDSATKELIDKGVNSDYAKQMVNNMLNWSIGQNVADEIVGITKDEQSPVTYKNADPRQTYKEFGDTVKKATEPQQQREIELEFIQANKQLTQEVANALISSGKVQNQDEAYRQAEAQTAILDSLAHEAFNQENIRPSEYYKRFHVNATSGNIEADEHNIDDSNISLDDSFNPVDFDEEEQAKVLEASSDQEIQSRYEDWLAEQDKTNNSLVNEYKILQDMGINKIRIPDKNSQRYTEYKELSPRIKRQFFTNNNFAQGWDEAEQILKEKLHDDTVDIFGYLRDVDFKVPERFEQAPVKQTKFDVILNTTAKDLVEVKTIEEIQDKLQKMFGSYEQLDNFEEGIDSDVSEIEFMLADKYMADLEYAAREGDYEQTQQLLDQLKKDVVEIFKLKDYNNVNEENQNNLSATQREDLLRAGKNPEGDLRTNTNKTNLQVNNLTIQDLKNINDNIILHLFANDEYDVFLDKQTIQFLKNNNVRSVDQYGIFVKDNKTGNRLYSEQEINDLIEQYDNLGNTKEADNYRKLLDRFLQLKNNFMTVQDKLRVYIAQNNTQRNLQQGLFDIFYQPAYHGTPHRFDEFSTDKIGTGEGAQVHGWGLYFAKDKKVSDFYKFKLTPKTAELFIDSKDFTLNNKYHYYTKDGKFYINGYDTNEQEKEISKTEYIKALNKAQEINRKAMEQDEKTGQLFKVDIPENDVLLDEQKTFDEQPKKVQEALLKVLPKKINSAGFDIVYSKNKNLFNPNDELIIQEAYQLYKQNPDKYFNKMWNNLTGREIYSIMVSHNFGNAKEASLALNNAGIKGITYDGQQDGIGYVIFDDKAVKVLEKFYQADKNYYERQARNVELRNKDNREKLLENGGTEEQADEIENLGALRHKIHSTDVNSLAIGDNEDVRKLDDGDINSTLEDAELPTLTTSESPLYTTQDTDDIIADYLDKSIDDLTASDKEKFNNEVVEMWAKWKEKVNNQIEKYLEDIDKKYKTQYEPTGKLRERFQQDDQQEQPRGATTIYDRQYYIDLFANSDKSTLLHETSHAFLNEILYFASAKNATKKVLDIKAKLDDWLGVPENNGRYSVRQQELFATSAESFFREGKAPTAKLKTVFERFKTWLSQIYDRIKDDLPKINDDVKELFDTILSRSYNVPDSNIYAGKESAIKEVIKNIQEGRASEVDGITIDDVYNLLNMAYTRKPTKPSKNLKQLLNSKNIYNFDDLTKAGADNVLQILKEGGYAKEDVTTETALELARQALDGKPIYRLADKWRTEGDIDFARNLRVLEKVIEFSQIDSVLEKILQLQQEGYRNIEQTDIKQTENDYKRLFSADVKEAKKIVEDIINRLHKKRFIDRAAQKQMINDLQFSATVDEIKESVLNVIEDLQDEIKLVKQQLKNPRKPIIRKDKTIPPGKNATEEEKNNYKKYMRKQINRLLKQALPRKQNQQKFSKFDVPTQRFFTDLEKYNKMTIEQAQEELYKRATSIIDDEGVGVDNFTKIENMFLSYKANKINQNSTEFYKQLYDNLQEINVFGRNVKDIENTLKKEKIQQDINSLVVNIEDNKSKNKGAAFAKKWYVLGLGNWWSTINAIAGKKQADKDSMEKNDIINFTEEGELSDDLKTKCAAAWGFKNTTDLDMTVYKSLNEEYTYEELDPASNTRNAVKLNKLQLMHCYIDMKNTVGRERIVRAYGNEQIADMMNKLTIQDKKCCDALQQTIADLYPEINKVYLRMYGLDMPQAENYFPFTPERIQGPMDLMKDNIGAASLPGFIKARAQSNLPLMNFGNPFQIALNHIAKVVHFINFQEKLADLNKVYKATIVKRHITNAYGETVYRYIVQLLDNEKFQNVTKTIDAASSVGDYLTNNYVLTKIVIKPSIMIKQWVSCINYAEDMSTVKWFEGFLKGLSHPKKTIDFMMKNSRYCKQRFAKGGQTEALLKAMEGGSVTIAKVKTFKGMLSWMTRVGDIGAIIFGGYPYVMDQMSKGVPLKTAIENFEKATIRSQQASMPSTLSDWQYRGMNNWLLRALFAFANTANQYSRKAGDTIYMYIHGDIDKKQLAKNLTLYGVLNPLMYTSLTSLAILSGLVSGDWDDLKDDIIMSLMQCSNMLSIPIIGQWYNYAVQRVILDTRIPQKEIPLLAEIMDIVDILKKQEIETKDWLTIIDNAASLVAGVPVKTLYNEFIGSTKDLLDGEYGKFAVKLYGATESRADKIFDN